MNNKINIIIHTPKKKDIPTLLQWGTTAQELQAGGDSTWHTKEILEEWIDNPGQHVFLVACIGTALTGMCLTHHMGDWAYCSFLYVDKKYRRLGIGKKLLYEAHRRMHEQGVSYFSLLVNAKNRKSKTFYTKLGFRKGYNFTWMYRRSLKS